MVKERTLFMRLAFPRFGLRALCLGLACLAVLLAVLSAPIRQAGRQRKIIQDVEALGGSIHFADEYDAAMPGYSQHHRLGESRSWFQRFIGDGYVRRIEWIYLQHSNDVPRELLREIVELPHLKQLHVSPLIERSAEIERLKQRRPQCRVYAEWNMSNAPVRTLQSEAEFHEAIALGNSVIFMDGGLSINVQLSRPLFAKLAAEWFTKYPSSDVRFLRVDYQRSASPAWEAALQWQLEHGVDLQEIEVHGAPGRVLWNQDGNLVRYDPSLRHTTVEDLIRRTEEAFDIPKSAMK
jgi:hypothetical protein